MLDVELPKHVDENSGCREVAGVVKVIDIVIGHHDWVKAWKEPIEADGLWEGEELFLDECFW